MPSADTIVIPPIMATIIQFRLIKKTMQQGIRAIRIGTGNNISIVPNEVAAP
jgi:hypothetical protein